MDEEGSSPQNGSGPSPTKDEKKEKRTSRACLTCRKRKSACHLYVTLFAITMPEADILSSSPFGSCGTFSRSRGASKRKGARHETQTRPFTESLNSRPLTDM